jgi:hypothetical protein
MGIASGPAMAQIRPPAVEPPDTTIGDPPPPVEPTPQSQGYPSTTSPLAAGTYLATNSWGLTIATTARFVILANLNNDAVLDRETGLVWSRQYVSAEKLELVNLACKNLRIGNRGGWRLPTVAELTSLLDYSSPAISPAPGLPVGHPFLLGLTGQPLDDHFWTGEPALGYPEDYYYIVHMREGVALGANARNNKFRSLCVRGPE